MFEILKKENWLQKHYIEALKHRWQKYIDTEGDYLEK